MLFFLTIICSSFFPHATHASAKFSSLRLPCLTAGLCVLKILPHCRVAGTWINILSDSIRKLKPNKQFKRFDSFMQESFMD